MNNKDQTKMISRRGFLGKLTAATVAMGFGRMEVFAQGVPKALTWNSAMELAVTFDIVRPSRGRAYRPYVAVWVEDTDGNPVRTLSLWVQTVKRGPKWIPDLRRWFRGEKARSARDGGNLVSTLSSPTRNPGTYTVAWNGLTDEKALVGQGEYYVCIESARWYGKYQLIREKVTIGDLPFKQEVEGNLEISGVSVEYRRRT